MKFFLLFLMLSLTACFMSGCDTSDFANKGAASLEKEQAACFGCKDEECLHCYPKRSAE